MFRRRVIFLFASTCFALSFISCTSNTKTGADNGTKPKNGHSDALNVKTYINSLDISLELKDSIFFEDVYVLEMMITNNSEYQLRDSDFQIKYFDSNSWRKRELKDKANIKTGVNLMKVNPHSKEPYIHYLSSCINKPGRYRLEITFDLLIPTIRDNENPLSITVSDEFVINSK